MFYVQNDIDKMESIKKELIICYLILTYRLLMEDFQKKNTHDLHFVYLTHGNKKKYKFNLETIK